MPAIAEDVQEQQVASLAAAAAERLMMLQRNAAMPSSSLKLQMPN
jgi:hypothetical protein